MILLEEDRKKLLKALESAPDDVLLRAVDDYMRQRADCERLWEDVRGFSGAKPPKLDVPPPPPPARRAKAAAEPEEPAEVEDVEPEGEAVTRIGRDTKEDILNYCRRPRTLDDIAKHMKRKPDIAAGLLKLLWSRDELKFDGECYRATA